MYEDGESKVGLVEGYFFATVPMLSTNSILSSNLLRIFWREEKFDFVYLFPFGVDD